MLARAAARSLAGARSVALTRSAALSRPPAAAIWSRGMAKGNKPQQQSRFSKQSNSPAAPKPAQPRPTPPPEAPAPAAESTPEPTSQPAEQSETPQAASPEPQEPIPDLSKLPDLTQGIPSTFEYETAQRSSASSASSAEGEQAVVSSSSRPKGELPASAYVSSSERRRHQMFNWMFAGFGVSVVASIAYLGRDWDEEEASKHTDIPNGWTPGLWWNRAMARSGSVMSYYQEPAFEKLLPDPNPSFERPYTLVISLEDMLIHNEWTREHGWRVAKRPGMDYFLRYLSQYYEIVLFTSQPFGTTEPLVRKLDPFRFIMWPLYREATKYKDGEIVKDLSYLNRDLSKVIIIDSNPKHVSCQPENAIVLPPWKGNLDDKDLVALVPFLEYINIMNYSDVRKVLKSFEGKDIPTEFARREAIARAQFNKQLAEKRGKGSGTAGGGMGKLGSMLGLKPSTMSLMVAPDGEEDPTEAFAKGKMLQDIARERGMRNYLHLEKQIRENGDTWLKEEAEAQEQLQKEAMKNMQSSFTGWFGVGNDDKKDEAKNDEAKKEEPKK